MSHLVRVSPLVASYITTPRCLPCGCGESKFVRVRTGSSSAYGPARPRRAFSRHLMLRQPSSPVRSMPFPPVSSAASGADTGAPLGCGGTADGICPIGLCEQRPGLFGLSTADSGTRSRTSEPSRCPELAAVPRHPVSPSLWIPPRVKHSDDNDHVRVDAKEQTIRESAKWRAPGTPVKHLIRLGMLSDETSRRRGCVEEAVSKPTPLFVVPPAGRHQVGLGGRLYDDGPHRDERIRAMASSQVEPVAPSRSRASSRRSSSSCWDEVNGIMLASAPRLSQSFSMRSRRSSMVRRSRSIAGSDMTQVSHSRRLGPIVGYPAFP